MLGGWLNPTPRFLATARVRSRLRGFLAALRAVRKLTLRKFTQQRLSQWRENPHSLGRRKTFFPKTDWNAACFEDDRCVMLARVSTTEIMIETLAQRRVSTVMWRPVIAAIVILLLGLPPAWAAVLCHCSSEVAAPHACFQTPPSDSLTEHEHPNWAGRHRSLPCEMTPSSSANSQGWKPSQRTTTCCDATPPRELEQAEVSLATPMGVEEERLLPPTYRQPLSQASAFIPKLPRQPQRPLYLALSCWLI